MKLPRKKPCKQCREVFQPERPIQPCCSPRCAIDYTLAQKAKKAKKQLTVDRREFKLNDKTTQRNLAQKYFNRWIRYRDAGNNDICCDKPITGQAHAGHYRPVGSHPALRFHEDNCHLQSSHCNNYKSGNLTGYRINLIKKIGLERVEWLEGHHEPKKYTVQDYVEIKLKYLKLCREMEAS